MPPNLVLVHGSPGPSAELTPLATVLATLGFPVRTLELPMHDASPIHAPIAAACDRDSIVVAYSFGCYLTLRAASAGALPGVRLCLVSPHLVSSGGLALPVALLLSVPGLNRKLIEKGLDERIDDHLRRCFSPAAPPGELRAALRDPALWLRAARWKQEQAQHPLGRLRYSSLPETRIVRGACDEVSPWAEQLRVFDEPPPEQLVTCVAGAGHALPWTHPAHVRDAVQSLLRG